MEIQVEIIIKKGTEILRTVITEIAYRINGGIYVTIRSITN